MALAPRLAPGSIFARDFKVVDLLAEGGMGAVYRAEQLSTRKLRALKLVSTRLADDPKGRQRFVREATIGASIDSEHVVEVIGAGIDDETGRPWLAMELLEGADLGALVQHQGALSTGQLREVVGQLCHGLSAAHRAGVVHRDLKPANVFVARSRRAGVAFTIKILDFGIAKVVQESGTGGSETDTVGSPLWMAPEQLNAQRPAPATDVWALGLLVFWALTAKHYWWSAHSESSTVQALFVEQLFKAIEAPSQRARELGVAMTLPPGFDQWFLRCLDRDPARRFPDANAAGAALLAILPEEVDALVLPDLSLPPSISSTEPHQTSPTSSEATLLGDPTGWDASAIVPASAVAAARSSFEGDATRVDPTPLGADLSRGPVPGMGPTLDPPRAKVSPLVVAMAVALLVGTFVGGGFLLLRWRANSMSVEAPTSEIIEARAIDEEPEPEAAATTGGTQAETDAEGSSSAGTEPEPAPEPDDPSLELVVPLRTQLGSKTHDVEFLGWTPQGHRFALRGEYRDDRRGEANRLELYQVHDALTGTMIESFLIERDAGPGVNRYTRLSKAAAEAKPASEWLARRRALGLKTLKPKRRNPSGGTLHIESDEAPRGSQISFPPSSLGVAFRWSDWLGGPEAGTPPRGPSLTILYELDDQRWPMLELDAPFSGEELLGQYEAGVDDPAVAGRVLAFWSPDGQRVVLMAQAEARPPGADPLQLRRWVLRAAGPQIRVMEAGAGQRRSRELAAELEAAGLPVALLVLREPAAASSSLQISRHNSAAEAVADRVRAVVPELRSPERRRLRGFADVVIVLGQDMESP